MPEASSTSLNRSIFYTVAVQFPSVIMGFATGVCITRLLQEVGRGYYTLLQSDVSLLVLLLSMNLGTGLMFYLAKGEADRERIIGIAATSILAMAGFLTIILVLASVYGVPANPFLPDGLNGFYFLAYLACTVFFNFTLSLITGVFLGLHLFRVINQMTLAYAIILSATYGSIFLVMGDSLGVDNLPAILLAALGALVLLNVIWVIQYLVHVRVRPVLFRGGPLLSPLISFALVGYLANLLNLLNYRLDIWFLQDLRGARELGLYAVSVGVAQFFFQVPEPLSRVLQPHLIGRSDKDVTEKYRLYSRLNFTLVLLGGLVLMLASNWLFPFVYGGAFAGSALAFRLLMPGILFACASKMMVLLVIRTGKVKYNVMASAIGLIFTIALNILLVPRYGLEGAAIASTVAYMVVFLVVAWVVFCKLGTPWGNYFLLMPRDVHRLMRA